MGLLKNELGESTRGSIDSYGLCNLRESLPLAGPYASSAFCSNNGRTGVAVPTGVYV